MALPCLSASRTSAHARPTPHPPRAARADGKDDSLGPTGLEEPKAEALRDLMQGTPRPDKVAKAAELLTVAARRPSGGKSPDQPTSSAAAAPPPPDDALLSPKTSPEADAKSPVEAAPAEAKPAPKPALDAAAPVVLAGAPVVLSEAAPPGEDHMDPLILHPCVPPPVYQWNDKKPKPAPQGSPRASDASPAPKDRALSPGRVSPRAAAVPGSYAERALNSLAATGGGGRAGYAGAYPGPAGAGLPPNPPYQALPQYVPSQLSPPNAYGPGYGSRAPAPYVPYAHSAKPAPPSLPPPAWGPTPSAPAPVSSGLGSRAPGPLGPDGGYGGARPQQPTIEEITAAKEALKRNIASMGMPQ